MPGLSLKPLSSTLLPFSWTIPSPTESPSATRSSTAGKDDQPQPPTAHLSSLDMKVFGVHPMVSEVGVVICSDCYKPVIQSSLAEHTGNCDKIRKGHAKKGGKDTTDAMGKRKADHADIGNGGDDATQPGKKRAKYAPSVNGKGRFKGPVDYDKHCGVINDKGLPCTRSLTCKSHSMGAKRAIVGRSRPFDELLLDWNRANNPNFIEPVKRETKAERKEKAEREKAEKLRLAREAAAAAGIDLDAEKKAKKKKAKAATAGAAGGAAGAGADGSGAGGSAGGGAGGGGGGGAVTLGPDGQPIGDVKKKKKITAKKTATAADKTGADAEENLNDIDSDVEVETLAKTVATARERGSVAMPLAVPCDTSSWFVARRERLRNCRDLLATALGVPASTSWNTKPGVIGGVKI